MLSLMLIALVVIVLTLLFGAAAVLRGFANILAALGVVAALGVLWWVFGDPWSGLVAGAIAVVVSFGLGLVGAAIYDHFDRQRRMQSLDTERAEAQSVHAARTTEGAALQAQRAANIQTLSGHGLSEAEARQFLDLVNRGERASALALYERACGKTPPPDFIQSLTSG